MRNFPSEFIARKNKVANPDAWVWLFRIKARLDALDDDYFFLAANNTPVTLDGVRYDPFNIELGGLSADTDGDVPEINITIGNQNQQLTAFVEAGDGLIGNEIKVILTNLEDPFTDSYVETLEILRCSIDNDEIQIQASYFALVRRQFPGLFYIKDFCRFEFLSTQCAVDDSVPNPGETCTKRLDGTFGCRDWGDREVGAAFPRKHPERFGAFPLLPHGINFEV